MLTFSFSFFLFVFVFFRFSVTTTSTIKAIGANAHNDKSAAITTTTQLFVAFVLGRCSAIDSVW